MFFFASREWRTSTLHIHSLAVLYLHLLAVTVCLFLLSPSYRLHGALKDRLLVRVPLQCLSALFRLAALRATNVSSKSLHTILVFIRLFHLLQTLANADF